MSKEQKITTDIKVPNKDLEALRINFPHCFDKDGNFQLEKFKNNLTEKEINFSTESYGLDWLGKSYARLLASDPATTLLKADETHNSKPENANSENLLIKGDNLEVLKHLANAYYEQVKMIYIDPPYNTGSDGFVYQDDRKFTVKELQQLIGVDEEKAKRILDFTQKKSNSHSAWLTFLYPRLYIAKQLLKDEGVIFISIDDNEVTQLRLLMDEVFGEENFVSQITVLCNPKGRSQDKYFATNHEYLLCYSNRLLPKGYFSIEKDIEQINAEYKEEDENGKYRLLELRNTHREFGKHNRKNMHFPLYVDPADGSVSLDNNNENLKILPNWDDGYEGCWTWERKNAEENIELLIGQKIKDNWKIYRKSYANGVEKMLKTIFNNKLFYTEKGQKEFATLFETKEKIFNAPKSVDLIKDVLKTITKENNIILDFFAGSGTTSQSVMDLNSEDCNNRRFILVQIPEAIDPKTNKVAYDFVKDKLKVESTIFEITKERIIRSAKKTKENILIKIAEKEMEIKDLEGTLDLEDKDDKIHRLNAEIKTLKGQDVGFKIFETIPIWEDYDFESTELDNQTKLFDESKLIEDDIKALLTTWKTYDGIALTQELEKIDLSGYTAYYGNGKLYLMNKGFKTDNLKNLLEKIDSDKKFNPTSIIAFGYHFDSKNLRELSENVKSYANKKNIDIDFITRY
jgi:adenine-specific DNA-methyltransferase